MPVWLKLLNRFLQKSKHMDTKTRKINAGCTYWWWAQLKHKAVSWVYNRWIQELDIKRAFSRWFWGRIFKSIILHSRVSDGIENKTQSAVRKDEIASPKQRHIAPVDEYQERERKKKQKKWLKINEKEESTGDKIKRSFFDRYVDKIKDFLDNAE
jgi:hypothetical protein